MATRVVLIILGLIYILNGLWTVAEPSAWYATLPGVSATGPMNRHFIEDIGFAGVASGTLLLLAGWRNSAAFAIGGALWPALHALIHIAGWFQHGFPTDIRVFVVDVVGVVVLSAIGVGLAILHAQRQGVR
jgi:hypothetical protein